MMIKEKVVINTTNHDTLYIDCKHTLNKIHMVVDSFYIYI